MFHWHLNLNDYLLHVLSPSLAFLDMVQFEQYDTNPIVTVETDANPEVNLTLYCHKLPFLIYIQYISNL